MLSWLDRFFTSAAATIGQAVADAVHWAVHALASVVFAVFGLVGNAWAALARAVTVFHAALDSFATAVLNFAGYVVHVLVPSVIRWAAAGLARLEAALAGLYDWAARQLAALAARITDAVAAVARWVITAVWDPLKSYADKIWNDLLTWGFYAYQVLTHLPALADALLLHLVASLERNAWTVARMLGTFTLSLILGNVRALVQVAEDIITAVL